MTEPTPLSPRVQARLEEHRRRRAELAADRAAFQARREQGLKYRHAAKLAYLAARARRESESEKETPKAEEQGTDAA